MSDLSKRLKKEIQSMMNNIPFEKGVHLVWARARLELFQETVRYLEEIENQTQSLKVENTELLNQLSEMETRIKTSREALAEIMAKTKERLIQDIALEALKKIQKIEDE